MELYNRAVTAAVCLLGGLAIGTFGLAALMNRGSQPEAVARSDQLSRGISRHELSPAASTSIALRTLELSSARKEAAELKKQLQAQTEALTSARRELQALVNQNAKLRAERNESLDLLISAFGDEPAPINDSPPRVTTSEPVENELESPNEQLQQIVNSATDELRSELELVRAELAESQAARQLERVAADSTREHIEDAMTELLARVGDEAIAALSEALEAEDAEVRRLAAKGLAAFGNRAQSAISALSLALADPDLRVREAAAAALRRIQD